MTEDNDYIKIDFYKLWKYVRINRTAKEKMKTLLFSKMPFLFNKFASYYHWKNARVFVEDSFVSNSSLYHLKKKKYNLSPNLAIVFHVYYPDVFSDVLNRLPRDISFKLFISCPQEVKPEVEKILLSYPFSFEIFIVENKGRDILPFLKILPIVFNKGFSLVLKLHTKRSNHLKKKEPWNTGLFNALLGKNNIENVLDIFARHPQVGMIGPEGNILPMSLYYGGNAKRVKELCLKMGLSEQQLKSYNFVAGSIFYARKEVLEPVLKLGLKENDFEEENEQLDNTLAHVVERIFPAGLILNDMVLADTSSTTNKIVCKLTLNHPYTI